MTTEIQSISGLQSLMTNFGNLVNSYEIHSYNGILVTQQS